MWLRANVVLVIAVVFALIQMFASVTGGPRGGAAAAVTSALTGGLTHSVAAQDDNSDNSGSDNSGSDNSDSSDNSGSDNSGSDNSDSSDNSEADNGGDDAVVDNVEAADNTDVATSAPAPTATPTSAPAPASVPRSAATVASPSPSPQPVTEVSGVTTGADLLLAMNGTRMTLQLFATLPPGITVTVRMVDPLAYPATPGIRAGDLIFQTEAKDATGLTLTTLPSEVNLAVHYDDADVTGLNEANITLAHYDPSTSQWQTAPKLMTDPPSNFMAATITDLGVYAVYVP
jgi:hypothetical protein